MPKLNLASGTDIKDPPWINLDIVPKWPVARRGCDIIWDARKDRIPFDDGTVDEIYAGYLFLHLAPCFHEQVMQDIRRVLEPGGRLVIGETDMEKVMPRWLKDPFNKGLYESIWGEQGDFHGRELAEFDKHCHGWIEASLSQFMTEHGFIGIQRINIHHPDVWWELTLVGLRA